MKPWEKYGQAGSESETPAPAGPWAKYSADQPELSAGNVASNVAQRGTDLAGNTAEFFGNILSGLEVRAMDALGTEQPLTQGLADVFGNPGIGWGTPESFAAEGREPAFTIGDTAFGFGELPVRLAGEGLSDVGRLVESTDTGYDPQYTIDRALDDPTLRNIGGAIAEQGPSSLVDMAALLMAPGPYLAGRTQEVAEARQASDLRDGPLPSNTDYAVALPTATIIQAIDRLALGKLLPKGSKVPVTSAGMVPGAIARAAGVEAATEAGQEGIEYVGTAAGTETGLDGREAIRRMIGGAMIGGPVGGLVRGGSSVVELRQAIRQQLAAEGVDPNNVSDSDLDAAIAEYIGQAEEASQAQTLAPESVAPVIEQATGVNTPAPLGTDMPRAEARQARRQVEQELGSLFEGTDVLRREDVDVTPEGLQLREGARPAQDPVGRQAQPSTLAGYRQAAAMLDEAGVELTPENLDTAVSYMEAGLSPVEAVRAFTRAARQGDMRTPPTVREQVGAERTRQAAEQAFRMAEARRERAKQDTARVGFGRQDAPTGDYRAGAARGIGDELSPRMAQERAAAGAQPPAGVNQDMQAPRRAVDRVAETLPGGLGGEFLAGDRPPAAPAGGPDVRPGRTFDQQGQIEGPVSQPAATAAPALEQRAPVQQTATPVGTTQTATEQQTAAPRTLQPGEDLVRSQIEAGPIGRLNLTPEDMQVIADEITTRSTDAVTGWLDARGGTMKSDVLMDAVAVAEETGQEVHFVNMDIGNLGGLNAFFNDVSAKANQAYRDIADIIRTELEALGPTTFMRTGGDELGAFVQGVSADQVEAAINQAKAKLQAYTEAEGMSGIEHAKTKEPGYGVRLHVAHTNVGADATGDTVYSATDARLKKKPETQNEQRQTGPEQQPAAPQDGGAPSRAAEPAAEDGGDAGTVLPERETGTGEAGPADLQRGRDDEVTADGDAYFESRALDRARNPGEASRERLVYMSPDDFLAMAENLSDGPVASKMAPVRRLVNAGTKFDEVPFLKFTHDGKGEATVDGHEGRHRAYMLKEMGVQQMPVVLKSAEYGAGQGIRWGRQGRDPGSFDVIDGPWPKTLTGQSGGSIPFPVLDLRRAPAVEPEADVVGDILADFTQETDADTDTPKKGPNIQFYSGIPLDAIAAKLKELFGGEAANWQRHLKQNSELFTALKESMQGRRPSVNPIAQAVRWYWQDADQRLRSIADRANMPGVKRIADAFLLRAGDAVGTGRETFHSRLNKRLNKQIDRVEGIRKAFDDAGLTMNDETMLRVRRMLENPSTPRIGKLGDVVRKMETFFQDELAYQRDAGLETGEVKGYLPRVIDKGKISANDNTRARFVAAAAKAYKIDNPRMTDTQARELGELRWQREVFGESSGTPGLVLEAGSPGSADFMKGRTLSQKAVEQSGLQDFMVNNPFNLMLSYLQSSAMRAELAKTEVELSDGSTVRIGPNWSNWSQIKQDLVSEGGDAAYEFMPEIEDMVATVSGIKARRHYGRFTRGLSWARTISTLGLLELATLTSLPEPLIGGIRMTKGGSTGGAMMDLANVVKSTARYGGDAARLLLRLPKRERLQATYDLLHSLGEINANNANAMSVDRFAGGEPASLLQSNLLAAYFRGIRLEQFTNYSVAFAAENSMTFMRQLAQDLAAGGKRADNARIHFRDLNVPAGEIDSFAAFVQSLDGGNPTAGELANAGRNGALYAGAMNKFIGESVMRPNAATKPAYAAHPLGASIFQLQSFPFMYTKQVLSRPFRVAQAQAADIGKLEAAYTALPFIVGLTTVVGLQSLLGGMRDEFAELTSGEENPPQSQMFELERALSWAGAFGKVDPILQMISGSRYQKSVFESAAGPTIGRIADGLDTALAAAVNNSPNTTSAERQLWNTSMDLLIEPLLQATASLAPDTGVTGAVMLAARAAGPRTLRERGGEALAPREKERLPRYSLAEKLVGADKAPKRDSGRERGREGGRENGRW